MNGKTIACGKCTIVHHDSALRDDDAGWIPVGVESDCVTLPSLEELAAAIGARMSIVWAAVRSDEVLLVCSKPAWDRIVKTTVSHRQSFGADSVGVISQLKQVVGAEFQERLREAVTGVRVTQNVRSDGAASRPRAVTEEVAETGRTLQLIADVRASVLLVLWCESRFLAALHLGLAGRQTSEGGRSLPEREATLGVCGYTCAQLECILELLEIKLRAISLKNEADHAARELWFGRLTVASLPLILFTSALGMNLDDTSGLGVVKDWRTIVCVFGVCLLMPWVLAHFLARVGRER